MVTQEWNDPHNDHNQGDFRAIWLKHGAIKKKLKLMHKENFKGIAEQLEFRQQQPENTQSQDNLLHD